MEKMIIETPLSVETRKAFTAGDTLYLKGTIYNARDMTQRFMVEELEKGVRLPFSLEGEIIFIGTGPSFVKRGNQIEVGVAGQPAGQELPNSLRELFENTESAQSCRRGVV